MTPTVKNWKILLQQSLNACKPLLTASSVSGLGRQYLTANHRQTQHPRGLFRLVSVDVTDATWFTKYRNLYILMEQTSELTRKVVVT